LLNKPLLRRRFRRAGRIERRTGDEASITEGPFDWLTAGLTAARSEDADYALCVFRSAVRQSFQADGIAAV